MATFTTNEEDQKKAAALQQRLADAETASSSAATAATAVATTTTENKSEQHDSQPVPQVDIAEGVHKYVLLSACLPKGGEQGVEGGGGNSRSVRHQHRQHFVVSKKNAAYHKDAAEPYVELLERNQYTNIRIEGGGRLALDSTKKTIYIYGYSYGFGLADHALSKSIIEQQHKHQQQQQQQPYTPYDITWSNEGY